ncbi:MAG TPA: GNAT family protein [Methanoregula sp.]|nr:GNAT family protein [Methanoregula sp.]
MRFCLSTKRLVLDELTAADLFGLRAIARDPDFRKYVLIWLDSEEQIAAFLQHAIDEAGKVEGRLDYVLAARDRTTREFIGLTFIEIDPAQKSTAEIGIVLLPAFCRKGYGSEILRAFLRFGFETLDMHRVYGKCDELNLASARLMEQCGLVFEGTLREHVWLRDHWRSTRYYGMLAGEYVASPCNPHA